MDPEFSAQGKCIIFERHNLGRSKPKNGHAIYVVNIDGSAISRITPWNPLPATATGRRTEDGFCSARTTT
jgi:hypothetical protein